VSTGAWALVVAVVTALAFGGFRAVTDGRFSGTHRIRGVEEELTEAEAVARASVLEGTPWADQLGARATLLQFSSSFCTPCRATRRVLEQVSTSMSGVAHIEVDAEHHLDDVRRLGIMRTPTTLVLDQHGREVSRATGVPTREQALVALAKALEE
jgi:thiol-disulfide isomerase/thioredoxin